MEDGSPISYAVLEEGTPVRSRDGLEVGRVKRVLAIPGEDIFDGLIVETPDGDRFVDSEGIDSIYERAVVLAMDGHEAHRLPEPTPSPAALELDATDVTESTATERARRIWDLISGRW